MSHWRYIKPNHCCRTPSRVIFFDTETLPQEIEGRPGQRVHKLRVGVAESGRIVNGVLTRHRHIVFTTPGEWWEWCFHQMRARELTWIIAHNLPFDLAVTQFWQIWDDGLVELDRPKSKRSQSNDGAGESKTKPLVVLADPPVMICLRHLRSDCRFVLADSRNWFRCSLSVMGHSCKVEKQDLPGWNASDDVWVQYCENDVEILKRTMIRYFHFVKSERLGNLGWTAASQAMNAFRHGRMVEAICLHDEKEVKQLERRSYFGGRTEVFKRGKLDQHVWQLDVSSLYPSVMIGNLYPVKIQRWEVRDEPVLLPPIIDPAVSIAEVELVTHDPLWPVRLDGEVYYPTGRFRTVLAGPELNLAVQKRAIAKWGSWATYKCAYNFDLFVEEFWQKRMAARARGDKLYDMFWKMLLNSLYGKFGQKSSTWDDVDSPCAERPWSQWVAVDGATGDRTLYRDVGNQTQKQIPRDEIAGSFPAIAAFVTAYGRLRMNLLRKIAGPSQVYYQGVDAIVVTNEGKASLDAACQIEKNELGRLHVVSDASQGEITGAGRYQIGDHIRHAGQQNGTLIGPDGTWQERNFSGVNKLFCTESREGPVEETITKRHRPLVNKGTVDSQGWITPLQLPIGS